MMKIGGAWSMLQIQLPWCRFSKPLLTPVSCNRSLFSVRNSSATSSSTIIATKPKQNEPWLIVGLGNPGKIFAATRHNVGWGDSFYYKIPLKQVLVIFDDLDLPFAKLRLLPKGGHGGHNGQRQSSLLVLRCSIRLGIGRPPGKMDPVAFVIRQFTKQ